MAQKKTSMFTLTERLTNGTGTTPVFGTIDLGSYVDVGDRQAIQIHSVDYIFQGTGPDTDLASNIGVGQEVNIQVTDLNRGALVFADDRALISSGRLNVSAQQNMTNVADMFPDNFGKGSEDGRYVVNDMLYLTTQCTGAAAGYNVTVRVNASIVTLTAKDFMAIAIQSTAADN